MTDPLERAERLTVSEALDIAAAIDNSDKDISSWEAKFLDDIMAQLGRGFPLSSRQALTLLEIADQLGV